MSKYIDADKLIAEIERRESEIKSQIAELGNFESNEIGLFNYLDLYDDIRSFITSLQQEQPEVDLEKDDIIDYVHSHFYYDKDFDGYGHSELRPVFTRDDVEVIARHFYELGKARKGE